MKYNFIIPASMLLGILFINTAKGQGGVHEINSIQASEQARIQEGVRSGQLTPREAAKLERQQAKIEADKRRAMADGVITPAEKRKLLREERKASEDIYRKKHNRKVMR